MDKNKKFWCAFSRLENNSSLFVNFLYSHFGDIEYAWNASEYELYNIEGMRKSSVDSFIQERKTINPDKCLEDLEKKNIDFLYPEDERYPYLLRHIVNPPTGLFMVGDLSVCNLERTLAVVGSRRASESAKNNLTKIISGFANSDICIVSGLAEGIDTVAHKSALNNNIKTIAVIGGGFDKLYPTSNKSLFEKIKDGNGVVLSEYWCDVPSISWHFPARNRIVSGLSKGTLVAEATEKSGAMITARLTLEQGRELMCMPGLITNPNTKGIYKLIKSGAGVVTDYNDILDYMRWTLTSVDLKHSTGDNFAEYSKEEKRVIECLQKDMLSFDEIILKTGLNINDLMVILTKLELEGIINQTDGNKYISV